MDRPANDWEFKILMWNLSANGFPPPPVEVVIPVIIPENPLTVDDIVVMFSYIGSGSGAITFGGFGDV